MEITSFIQKLSAALVNTSEIEDPKDFQEVGEGERVIGHAPPNAQALYMLLLEVSKTESECKCPGCSWQMHALRRLFWERCKSVSKAPPEEETSLGVRIDWQIVSFKDEEETTDDDFIPFTSLMILVPGIIRH